MIVVSKLSWKCELGAHTEAKCVWSSSSCLLLSYKIGLSQRIEGGWRHKGGVHREEGGKGHRKAFWWQEWKGSGKAVRSVMFLIWYIFLAFHLGKIGYVQANSFSIVRESRALRAKPANIIQERVQEASTLCRKTTCSESVFIFKLMKLIAVKHMLNWKAPTHA